MANGGGFLDIKEVAPWGRSFDEYLRIFGLDANDLSGSILDCGGGPASFAAEGAQRGIRVVACDPIYRFSRPEIEARVREVYPLMLAGMRAERDRFVWKFMGSPEKVAERRMAAMGRFLDDLPEGLAAGRYMACGVPNLPFQDAAFDLALSSHFLFLYSDQLTEDFHVAAVQEIMRVASEARIYPLIALDGTPSVHLEPVIFRLRQQGFDVNLAPIEFEFQRGANQLMRIRRKAP